MDSKVHLDNLNYTVFTCGEAAHLEQEQQCFGFCRKHSCVTRTIVPTLLKGAVGGGGEF